MACIPRFPDKELYDQLRAKESEIDSLTQRTELAKGNFRKLQEQCDMVKIVVGNFIDKENTRIQRLKDQMHEVWEAKKVETKKVEALEQLLKTKDN